MGIPLYLLREKELSSPNVSKCPQQQCYNEELTLSALLLADDNNPNPEPLCLYPLGGDARYSFHSRGYLLFNGESTHLKYFYESAV